MSIEIWNPSKGELDAMFVGRKVVLVDQDTLVLDDGTRLTVEPNEGGCSCGGGDYSLDDLNTFDNAITSVEEIVEGGEYETTYRVFVFAAGIGGKEVITVSGDDGSGYYGTGYHVVVSIPTTEETQ